MNKKQYMHNRGWATIELLLTLPVLFAIFLMTIHFGHMLYTKITLGNATHVAAQILAKTDDCSNAQAYFNANFNRPGGATVTCSSSGKDRIVQSQYQYEGNALMFLFVPPTILQSESTAYLEKPAES